LHKILNDGGIRLSLVFTDLQCISAQAVIKGILEDKPIPILINMLKGRTKKKADDLRRVFFKPLGDDHKFLLHTIMNHIAYLKQECQKLDARIFNAMKPYNKQWQILQTIPGIDSLAASIIIAETGVDMHQFKTTEKFCSWAGMCPGNNESAGKRKSSQTVKGSSTLRRILCEVANAAARTRSQFQGYYKSLKIRLGHKRTIIATGHKVLRVIFKLLMDDCAYHDSKVNYEELMVKRNAPRWLNCLKQYGYL
jgi:transposase